MKQKQQEKNIHPEMHTVYITFIPLLHHFQSHNSILNGDPNSEEPPFGMDVTPPLIICMP